jgi:hypothetical protein
LAAATSIAGIIRRRAKGDQAARTSSAEPASICSNVFPSLSATPALVIAAVASVRIETMRNLARMIATRSSTSRRAHRPVAGQTIATKVRGRKKTQM